MSHFIAWTKRVFTTNQNFPLDLLLFKHVVKNKLSKYFWVSFRDYNFFLLKRYIFSEFSRKFFKTTGKHTLAVCGSFRGENFFLLIFVPFYWFDQKQLLKQIQIFLSICSFSNKKTTNFLSISMLLPEIVTFVSKKSCFQWISQKCFKKQKSIV